VAFGFFLSYDLISSLRMNLLLLHATFISAIAMYSAHRTSKARTVLGIPNAYFIYRTSLGRNSPPYTLALNQHKADAQRRVDITPQINKGINIRTHPHHPQINPQEFRFKQVIATRAARTPMMRED